MPRLPETPSPSDARSLVLGAAVGFRADQVRIFIESLRATGYTGDIVMLVGLRDFALARYLRQHGATPKRIWFIRRFHGPIHAYRFELLADVLRKAVGKYDRVLVSDVRDVVFQTHPFAGITGDACHFFLEGDMRTIGNEPTNMVYMRSFLPPDQVERISAYRISCCGVVLGGAKAMTAYMNRIASDLAAVPLKVRRKIGADTAFHNRMAHLDQDNPNRIPVVLVENNVHVATMGIEPASSYRAGPDGAIRTLDGHLPAILHQYDRLPEIKAPVMARWNS
jgi:hypothetical protein